MKDTLGHLLICIEEIPRGSNLPADGINDWTMIQHEDAMPGEGGRCHGPKYGIGEGLVRAHHGEPSTKGAA
jgi:hypothetical protein